MSEVFVLLLEVFLFLGHGHMVVFWLVTFFLLWALLDVVFVLEGGEIDQTFKGLDFFFLMANFKTLISCASEFHKLSIACSLIYFLKRRRKTLKKKIPKKKRIMTV